MGEWAMTAYCKGRSTTLLLDLLAIKIHFRNLYNQDAVNKVINYVFEKTKRTFGPPPNSAVHKQKPLIIISWYF